MSLSIKVKLAKGPNLVFCASSYYLDLGSDEYGEFVSQLQFEEFPNVFFIIFLLLLHNI